MVRSVAIVVSCWCLSACGGPGKSIAQKESDDVWKGVETTAKKDDETRAKQPRKIVVTPKRLCVADANAPAPNVGIADPGKPKPPQLEPLRPDAKAPARSGGMRGMGLGAGRGIYEDDDKRKLAAHVRPYDKDSDGELSDSERRNMIRDLAGKLFLQLDRDKDNRISVAEAKAACGTYTAIYVSEFASRDIDRDGFLSRFELENAFDKLTGK